MNIPKVSVIIPNYNHERYLDARIQSVLNQDFLDFEIILLDDASTDNSVDIIHRYLDHDKFKIEINLKNSGSTFEQWRKGISLAQGDYIWIAESDDLSDPKFLSVLVSELEVNPKIVLAYCQSNYINETSDIIGTAKAWTDDLDVDKWNYNYINNGIDECKFFMSIKNTIPNASAVVFRRSSFARIDTKTNMRLCGDWLIWSRLISLGDLYFCKDKLNYFRIHTNNVRSHISKELTAFEFLKVSQEIVSKCALNQQEMKIVSDKIFLFWNFFLLNFSLAKSIEYVNYLYSLNKFNAFKLLFVLINYRFKRYINRIKIFFYI